MISEIKRKTLPALAKVVGINKAQPLQHFLAQSPWSVEALRKKRRELLLSSLGETKLILVIDETGERKKGKTTDYVDHQYIGNSGKIDNGIVLVNADGVVKNMSFPLMFKIFKPKKRLKEEDTDKPKIELAVEIINELIEKRFKFEIVLADSL